MTKPTGNSGTNQTEALGDGTQGETLTLPARLDRYVLTELLGAGGMGWVYKADQHEPVFREVAVKLLAADSVDARAMARFDAERQALARMSHPNIAQVYDGGRTPRGKPYFVMEYVPGETLLDYCNGHRLTLATRLDLFERICSALAHAHKKGIIHRDIKPSNILVTEQDGQATPKVIDFGLAKAMAGHLADQSLRTHAGTVLGTPTYMSPEQAALSGEGVDVRTDIYALGLVLYQLTTGALPFNRVGEDGTAIEEVLRSVREDEPTRPSQRVAAQEASDRPPGLDAGIGKALREDLDWIILKCLEKDPENRYQNANDLLADLERYRAHQPVRARRTSVGYFVAKGARRYRVPLVVAAGVVLLGAVLGGGWLNSRMEAAARARAAQRFGQTVQRMDSVLRVAHTIPVHDISPVLEQIRTKVADLKSRLDSMEDWAKGPAYYAIGRGLLALDRPRDALEQLKGAWDAGYRAPSVAYALGLAYGRVYEAERRNLTSVTDPKKHDRLLKQIQAKYREPALEFLRRGAEAGARATVYGKALIAFYEKEFQKARRLAGKAISNQPWLYEAEILIADTWYLQAVDARLSGEREEAIAAYRKAEEAYRRAAAIGQSDPEPYRRLCSMAGDRMLLAILGSGSNAQSAFESGRRACKKAITINPEAVLPRANLAWLYVLHGQVIARRGKNPIPAYTKVIEIASRAIELNPDKPKPYLIAGTGYQRLAIYQLNHTNKNPSEALDKAASLYREVLARDKDRVDIYNELGNVYSIRGEYLALNTDKNPMPDLLAATEYYKTGLEMKPEEVVVRTNLGFNYTVIANYQAKIGGDAVKWYRKAFNTYKKVLEENPNLLTARLNLGVSYLARGDYAKSTGSNPLPWWERAIEQFKKVAAVDPEDTPVWQNLSEAWLKQARYLQSIGKNPTAEARHAIEAADKANGITPTADAWFTKAQALMILSRQVSGESKAATLRRRAVNAYKETLALKPDHEEARAALARLKDEDGQPPADV